MDTITKHSGRRGREVEGEKHRGKYIIHLITEHRHGHGTHVQQEIESKYGHQKKNLETSPSNSQKSFATHKEVNNS